MNKETLKRATDLKWTIDTLEKNIKSAEYTQSQNVELRKSYLKFNGVSDPITIPEALFRVIGKLVLSELLLLKRDAEEEFESL